MPEDLRAKENGLTGYFEHGLVWIDKGGCCPPKEVPVYTVGKRKFYLTYEGAGGARHDEKRSINSLLLTGKLSDEIRAKINELDPRLLDLDPEFAERKLCARFKSLISFSLRDGIVDDKVAGAMIHDKNYSDFMRAGCNGKLAELERAMGAAGPDFVDFGVEDFELIYHFRRDLYESGAVIVFHSSKEDSFGQKLPSLTQWFTLLETKNLDELKTLGAFIRVYHGLPRRGNVKFTPIESHDSWIASNACDFKPRPVKSMGVIYKPENGDWHVLTETGVIPMARLDGLSPYAGALHYAEEAFEGLKVVMGMDGKLRIPNIDEGVKRMLGSMKVLGISDLPSEEELKKTILNTVIANRDYVPAGGRGILYIRPVVAGIGPTVAVKPSKEYVLLVLVTPVADYLGKDPVSVELHNKTRAGAAGKWKLGGSYFQVMLYDLEAEQRHRKALYVDKEGFVSETNGANFFVVKKEANKFVIKTPPVKDDNILPGNTRASIIALAHALNMESGGKYENKIEVVEADMVPGDVYQSASAGFLTGTAAGVVPIKGFCYAGDEETKTCDWDKDLEACQLVLDLKKRWEQILMGETEDTLGTCYVIE